MYSYKKFAASVALIVLMFSSGCVTKVPPSQAEDLPVKVPSSFVTDYDKAPFWNGGWVRDIEDPMLPAIIKEALEHNYNLVAAEGRLEAAQATAVIQGAGKYPNFNLGNSGSRAQRNNAAGVVVTSRVSNSFGLIGRTSWELDLWGAVRDQASAGLAEYQASIEDYRAARFSIAAQAARAWYRAIAAELQLDISRRSLEVFESNLEIVDENFKRGIVQALDLHLVRANVANARSSYELSLRDREAAKRGLEIILGRYPSNEIKVASEFPKIKHSIPAGLPDDLLNRRPDIRAAERRLAADSMSVKAAKKARLPGISLNASYGTNTQVFDQLLDERFRVWSYGYNLNLPLFTGGRLEATEDRIQAQYKQSLANYAQTVLNAFEEVESALFDQESLRRDEEALREAVDESLAAEELAWEQYSRGLVDIITVLESQRRAFNSLRSLTLASNQRIQSRIGLYLVLGGGFAEDDLVEIN